jgi:DNA-binding beta-propeller fold protein YncE
MKTDIAKVSFDEVKHFVGVFHQMGRVNLESDINEQSELMLRMVQRVAGDAMQTGSPNQGFRVDTRVLLDALESRRGWTPTPATAMVFVDYFNRRVGDGSLVAIGATAIARTLDAPIDLSQAVDLLLAFKADPVAPCTFYVSDGSNTHDLTMTELYTDDGWRVVRATPGAWPAGFASNAVKAYGFKNMTPATRYSFDFLKADLPLNSLLVRTDLTDAYSALPAAASLTVNDDQRLWGSTSLRATAATQVTHTLPEPRDCSRARKLLVAVQSSPAAAALTITLLDNATPAASINLGGAAVSAVGAWRILSFPLPQAGAFNWSAVAALRYSALDVGATYTLGPVLLQADPALDLVVMGGDGTSAGAGRFYGEGMAAVKEFDGTYFTQADLPQADPAALVPVSVGSRRIDWAYLDLWERPLTYVEHAALRDVALDGDDTCTRKKLIAQVRLIKGVEVPFAGTAAAPADVFAMLPRCGHGVLSTKDKPAAVLDPCADPCEPAIAGPYLGEENRLFRVEIHRPGNVGAANLATTAQYKWSRQNGALTSGLISDAAVGDFSVQVEKPELYAVGDVIELADDLVELITGAYEDRVNHRNHLRGELRRVVTINLQTRRLSWQDPSIVDPAETVFHTALPRALRLAEHAKVTQWDGVAATTPGDQVLADGVVIEFGGSMIAGDYWQFATRTADRSVERLIEAPPHGTLHTYFPLAAIHRARENLASTEIVFAEDLRPRFAALPSLDASRIAYDPGACAAEHHIDGWDEVTTVQQALDALCRADLTGDMKLHNKLLHGMGVICGLKLRCSKDRSSIILGKGYALDCEGNLLHQDGEQGIALVTMAQNQGLLVGPGNGKVNLWVEQGAGNLAVHIEPNAPQTFWQSVLEGSLLLDFWNKYVLDLFNFLKGQLTVSTVATMTLPLPDSHKRVLSLINLIWQKVNSSSGPFIFVSKAEHDLLGQFHDQLQDKLASKTYCALFDTLTVFPGYPYVVPPGIDTMFGMMLWHRRMKLAPGGAYLATYGVGNEIQIFDAAARTLVVVTPFPGVANLIVRDVAFNAAGTEMYAVGTFVQSGKTDSVFATATITPPVGSATAPTLTWGPSSVVCDIEFVSLATHAVQAGRLFAIGRSALVGQQGLYRFDLPAIPMAPVPKVVFNGTGLLAIDTDGINAVAAAQANPALMTPAFTGLRRVNLNTFASSAPAAFNANGHNDYDDLAIANGSVFLTGNGGVGATLFRFRLTPESALPQVALGPLSIWRLGLMPASNALAIVDTNTYRARMFNTSTATLINNMRIPLQIMPTAIAVRADETEVYVLNMGSNTVNAININTLATLTPSFTAEPPVTLAAYRAQMLAAFTDLTSVLVQHFKDSWCDLFLVECPECKPGDKVYLGTIEIKNNEVFNISNFSKRHYAKSFRTWGYWLSAFPLLSFVKKTFGKFASSMLVP